MNSTTISAAGAVAMLLALVFPPWTRTTGAGASRNRNPAGYSFILRPPEAPELRINDPLGIEKAFRFEEAQAKPPLLTDRQFGLQPDEMIGRWAPGARAEERPRDGLDIDYPRLAAECVVIGAAALLLGARKGPSK